MSFGILERQTPTTSAVVAHSALQKMLQGFFDQFQAASFMFAAGFFYSVQAQICMHTLQLLVFDVSEKMPFGSNDIEEESAANSIPITMRKNKEGVHDLDTIW